MLFSQWPRFGSIYICQALYLFLFIFFMIFFINLTIFVKYFRNFLFVILDFEWFLNWILSLVLLGHFQFWGLISAVFIQLFTATRPIPWGLEIFHLVILNFTRYSLILYFLLDMLLIKSQFLKLMYIRWIFSMFLDLDFFFQVPITN